MAGGRAIMTEFGILSRKKSAISDGVVVIGEVEYGSGIVAVVGRI